MPPHTKKYQDYRRNKREKKKLEEEKRKRKAKKQKELETAIKQEKMALAAEGTKAIMNEALDLLVDCGVAPPRRRCETPEGLRMATLTERKKLKKLSQKSLERRDNLQIGKVCTVCNTLKPMAYFLKDSTNPDGRRVECRACNKLRRKINRTLKKRKDDKYTKKVKIPKGF